MKISIERKTFQDETWHIMTEVRHGRRAEGLEELRAGLEAADARMYELNQRMLRGGEEAGRISPEAAQAVDTILRMVHGISLLGVPQEEAVPS